MKDVHLKIFMQLTENIYHTENNVISWRKAFTTGSIHGLQMVRPILTPL